MDEATARVRLERMVASDQIPALTGTEVDDLIELAKRPDSDGVAINDPDWTPTWDLGAAAAEGWRWKAAKVAGHFDFGADGSNLSKSQVMDHCLRMAEVFATGAGRRGGATSFALPAWQAGDSLLVGDVNWNG